MSEFFGKLYRGTIPKSFFKPSLASLEWHTPTNLDIYICPNKTWEIAFFRGIKTGSLRRTAIVAKMTDSGLLTSRSLIYIKFTFYSYIICLVPRMITISRKIDVISWTNIEKIYVYAKHPYEVKYQFLINKWKKVGLKHCDQHKGFYSILKRYAGCLQKYWV